jgi:lipopolysaccharide export system permease protein
VGLEARKRGAPLRFTIIQRYVIGEVLRSFSLALAAMTAIFVLFMVVGEAMHLGLSPDDIVHFVPLIVPSTLPFSVPVSLLFAATVVYGRLASDNEIVAIKTAGVHPFKVLFPVYLLGAILSAVLFHASATWIPRSSHTAKLVIFKNSEEMFYKYLRRDHELKNPHWPFQIYCRAVEGKTMIQATFKHRERPDTQDSFDMIVRASRARIQFLYEQNIARVYLDDAEVYQKGTKGEAGKSGISKILIKDNTMDIPLPEGQNQIMLLKSNQEWTTRELLVEQQKVRNLLAKERKRQSIAAALWMASGRIGRVNWREFQAAFVDYNEWTRKDHAYETEIQQRNAMAFGSLFFVLLGAPVGIRFAKRDFLSEFITCFMPIIGIYYPLMLIGINVGKEGVVSPLWALWAGNMVLGVLTGAVLPPIFKH